MAMIDCGACVKKSPQCEACLKQFRLPLITTLRNGAAQRVGFARFGAIYLLTTWPRWQLLGESVRAQLLSRRVGPEVRVVNGTAVDLQLHRAQLGRATSSGQRHRLAVSWAHTHAAHDALASNASSALVLEDDVRLMANSYLSVDRIMSALASVATWTGVATDPKGVPSCLRLGFAFMWARNCSWNESSGFATFGKPRDVRSSVAVAYNRAALHLMSELRWYSSGGSPKTCVDTLLGRAMVVEHLPIPPLATQVSKATRQIGTLYGALSSCWFGTMSQYLPARTRYRREHALAYAALESFAAELQHERQNATVLARGQFHGHAVV